MAKEELQTNSFSKNGVDNISETKEELSGNSFNKQNSNNVVQLAGGFGIAKFGSSVFGTKHGHTVNKSGLQGNSFSKEGLANKIS